MAVVRVPTPLRRLVGNQRAVSAQGATLADLIVDLERQFPGIRARLVDDEGNLLSFVNIFVDNEDVRFLQGLRTPVSDTTEVSIVPAMAGGA
ncbi:MAG TPA: MoaD/ThiS family protein [bacterium]|jgi:molybdopterin synthase sulfur carrier subunit